MPLRLAILVLEIAFASGCGTGTPSSTSGAEHAERARDATVHIGPAESTAPATMPAPDHIRLHPGHDPEAPCTCAAEQLRHGWCWRCNVGWIAGHRVESARLFETLDPHGHQLDLQSLQLQMCTDAIRSHGWCSATGMGFVNGIAYFTRLTYGLARGTPIDVQFIQCAVCARAGQDPRWCSNCSVNDERQPPTGRGMVGNVAIGDRAIFEATATEYLLLMRAIDKAETCEWCAAAMVVHRVCPLCRISYEGDVPAHLPPPKAQ